MTDKKQKKEVIGPKSDKQKLVLKDNETDVLLVGGGMGGSKSYTCLLKALHFVQDPAARVLIVRETYPLLKLPGGLVDESQNIYRQFKATWKMQPLTWVFPNGAEIKFAALPQSIDEWRGLQSTHILVDEAHSLPEATVLFLLSRIRSGTYKGHMSLIMTCNPDRNSFLFNWVEYCLDDITGVPREGTEHVIRYFINTPDGLKWGNSREGLFKEHGVGKTLGKDFLPKSFRFIPMLITDNPSLIKNNPDYLASLHAMGRVEQLKYRMGSWTAVPSSESFVNREKLTIIDSPPKDIISMVRAWDLAATPISEVNRNPDYTAGVLLARTASGKYVIMHVKRVREAPDVVLKTIISTAIEDGLDIPVTIPRDPGAAARAADMFYTRELGEAGLSVRSITVSGHATKVKKFLPVATVIAGGSFFVLRDHNDDRWNENLLVELENFDGHRSRKDDQVDALSDAFKILAAGATIPSFSLPTLEKSSPIPRL